MSQQTTLDVPSTEPRRIGVGHPMSTRELDAALHAHFIKPDDRLSEAGAGAVYLTEVTAPGSNRRADAVHIGLWQSRGAGRIDVCELKVSRADWRRELDKPAKAEAWWPYSTTFSIVAPSTDIVPPEELPDGWGLMVPKANSRRFTVVVKPAEREPSITLGLLLTLLKNTETTRVNDLRLQQSRLVTQHYEELQRARREKAGTDPKFGSRLALLDRLEVAMGMKLSDYSWTDLLEPEEAAEGLVEFMRGHKERYQARERAERQAQRLDDIAKVAAEQAQKLREAHR